MKLKRQKLFSDIDSDIVKQFLGRLSGFVHKAKSLHWAAEGKGIHEYLDDIWEETYKFQDTVAEGWMGISGQLDSDIPFLMPESNSPVEFIHELEEKTEEVYSLLPDDPKFSGLKGEFESFIQTVEKYKYLFSLCGEKSTVVENGQKEFARVDYAGLSNRGKRALQKERNRLAKYYRKEKALLDAKETRQHIRNLEQARSGYGLHNRAGQENGVARDVAEEIRNHKSRAGKIREDLLRDIKSDKHAVRNEILEKAKNIQA